MRTRCQDTQAGSNEEKKGARKGETSFTDGRRSSVGGTGAGHSIAGRTTLFHIRGVRVEHVAINNLLRREGRSAGIRSRAILSRRFSSPSSSSSAVFSLFLSCDLSPSLPFSFLFSFLTHPVRFLPFLTLRANSLVHARQRYSLRRRRCGAT